MMSEYVVDVTLYLLILISAISWSWALIKYVQLQKDIRLNHAYLQKNGVLTGGAVSDCEVIADHLTHFFHEHAEFLKRATYLESKEASLDAVKDLLEKIQAKKESGLSFFATIGSAAPFIGLFGTVWGIKDALVSIAAAGQAGLDVVAGPIGEALIATAIGIAVALPAVVFYNVLSKMVATYLSNIEMFVLDRSQQLLLNKGV